MTTIAVKPITNQVPNGWRSCELKDLLERLESGLRPRGGVNSESGAIPSLGGENIKQEGGIVYFPVRKISRRFYLQLKKGKLRDRDVLINKDGANTGKVGFYESDFYPEAAINEHVFLLRGRADTLENRYLYYLLASQNGQRIIQSRITGSAQPGLNTSFIKDFPAAVPASVTEQEEIAAILATVDELISRTEALIEKIGRVKQGLMQDLLTQGIDEKGRIRSEKTHKFKVSPLGRVPEEWEVGDFDHFGIDIIDGDRGTHYPTEKDLLKEGYCAFLNNKNINQGELSFRETQFITEERDALMRKGRLEVGDIVLTTRGTVGNIALFRDSGPYQVVRINSGMVIVRGYAKRFTGDFFVRLWLYVFGKQNSVMGSGSAQPQLPIRELRRFCLAKPSTEEQNRITSILVETDMLLKQENRYREKLQALKRALMEDLLTGKVRVNHLTKK